jgi:hypothetical protein
MEPMLLSSRAAGFAAAALCLSACGEVLFQDPRRDAGADAGPVVPSLRVTFEDPTPLRLEPGSTVELGARVTDLQGRPTRAEVRFALLGESSDATLLATRVTSAQQLDGAEIARVQLQAANSSALFTVRASTADGATALREVSVSDRGFGTVRAVVFYDGVRGPTSFELALYSDGRCDALRATRPVRVITVPPTRGAAGRFTSLAADRDYAVVVEGVGAGGERVSRACAEGVHVERDGEREVSLRPLDLELRAAGAYDVRVQLGLDVVARAGRALWMEAAMIPPDEHRAILRSVADAVERSSGLLARATFEDAVDNTLAADVELDLRRRDAQPSRRLALFADAISATIGGTLWNIEAQAQTDEATNSLSINRVSFTVDPQTPFERADDLSREMPSAGTGLLVPMAGDRASVTLDRVSLTVSDIAIAARDAHLARTSARNTSERLRGEVRCDLLAPTLRAFTSRCDIACVTRACEAPLEDWARRFDAALLDATGTLRTARATFVGVARATAGSITVQSIATAAVEGSFVEDPSRPVRGAGTITRR